MEETSLYTKTLVIDGNQTIREEEFIIKGGVSPVAQGSA